MAIEITSVNYNGYTTDITFSAATGGTQVITGATIPYTFDQDYVYGDYSIYIPSFNKTCDLNIPVPIPVFPDWTLTGDNSTQYFSALNNEIASITFDPSTQTSSSSISTSTNGYFGVILAKDSGSTINAYAIPYTYTYISKINISTYTATTVGSFLAGNNKFMGGVLALNGKIYLTPHDSTQVLVFDPTTETTSLFGSFSGTRKWSGAVVANNGYIYCVPRNATTILKIDPSTNTASTFGTLPGTLNKYRTCVLAPNGMIYAAPQGVSDILKIDPSTDTVSTISVTGSTNYNSSTLGADGKYYMWNTNNGGDVLVLDPSDDSYVYQDIGETLGRTFQSTMAPDGTLGSFTSVDSGEGFYSYDLDTGTITNYGTYSATNDQAGSILLPNGQVLGVPFNASVMRVAGSGGESLDENWVLSRYFNKL